MVANKPDVFRSQNDPNHTYRVFGSNVDPTASDVLDGVGSVVALTSEGVDLYTPGDVLVAANMRQPRWSRTGAAILRAAEFRWALNEVGERGGPDG